MIDEDMIQLEDAIKRKVGEDLNRREVSMRDVKKERT